MLAENILKRLGIAATAEIVGASLTGIGIVLGIVGFGWSLYALYMEDDLNDTFLKRSYWGIGDQPVSSFGDPKPPLKDASRVVAWVESGMDEEMQAFAGLTLGIKVTVEWAREGGPSLSEVAIPVVGPAIAGYRYMARGHVVKAKLESSSHGAERRVAWSISVKDQAGTALASASESDVSLRTDKDSGRDVLEVALPLDGKGYENAAQAEFTYKLYEKTERASLSSDTLRVKKN